MRCRANGKSLLLCAIVLCGLQAHTNCTAAISTVVRNGTIIEPHEHETVGIITVLSPDQFGLKGIGTGTLLGPDLVLTAAHVIHGAASPQHIKFSLDGGKLEASAIAYSMAPGYLHHSDEDRATDLALIKLDRPFPQDLDYCRIATRDCESDELATVVGYGQDETQKLNVRMKGTLKYLKRHRTEVLVFVPGDDKNQITDSGDSGGPLFVSRGGKREIIAVVSGGYNRLPDGLEDDRYDALDMGLYVDVRRHIDWLNASISHLAEIRTPARPVYLRHRLSEGDPRSAFTKDLLEGLVRSTESDATVRAEIMSRGISEPWTLALKASMLSAGATDQLVSSLEAELKPVLTSHQLLALIEVGTDERQLLQMVWKQGGVFGEITESVIAKLTAAGASPRLGSWLQSKY